MVLKPKHFSVGPQQTIFILLPGHQPLIHQPACFSHLFAVFRVNQLEELFGRGSPIGGFQANEVIEILVPVQGPVGMDFPKCCLGRLERQVEPPAFMLISFHGCAEKFHDKDDQTANQKKNDDIGRLPRDGLDRQRLAEEIIAYRGAGEKCWYRKSCSSYPGAQQYGGEQNCKAWKSGKDQLDDNCSNNQANAYQASGERIASKRWKPAFQPHAVISVNIRLPVKPPYAPPVASLTAFASCC